MGTRFLTDLASVLRNSKYKLQVTEVNGWQTRSRSSGGYESGYPCAIVNHHTASSATPKQDVDYICYNAEVAPISNLFIDRTGMVWICAAGATNHAGSGGPLGPIPQDGMNSRSIGIEHANNGIGEVWPTVQQDVSIRVNAALCEAYGIQIGNVVEHFEWAPSRKIDRAGQSRYAQGSNKWNADAFRGDVVIFSTPSNPTPPNPTPPDDNMPSTDEIKGMVREVLNEGAVEGTGGNPQYPGKPWAEGNAAEGKNVNTILNVVKSIEKKLDEFIASQG